MLRCCTSPDLCASLQVDGLAYPLEMQMLHRGKQGKLAIVSVLFASTDAVKDNLFLKSILAKLPGYGSLSGSMLDSIKPLQGIPSSPEFYAYAGSLTMPPCEEKVLWLVMKQAAMVSFSQILKIPDIVFHLYLDLLN